MARNLSVSFGLLTIQTKSDVATIPRVDMSNLCVGQTDEQAHDPLPLKAPKKCDTCGPIVDYDRLAKGIPAGGGAFTVVSQDEVAEAKVEYAEKYKGGITLVPHDAATFLAATAPGDSLHYLTPADATAANHYALLARLVAAHPELAFVGLHTPMSATSLYRVTVRENVLVLEKRVREQSMKPLPAVAGEVNEQFYSMLEMSLPMLTTAYDPAGYEDAYATAVATMAAQGEVVGGKPKVVDDDALMAQFAALAAS